LRWRDAEKVAVNSRDWTHLRQDCPVLRGAVAHVLVEPELRVLRREVPHHIIPVAFGEDGRTGCREGEVICAGDGFEGVTLQVPRLVAVDDRRAESRTSSSCCEDLPEQAVEVGGHLPPLVVCCVDREEGVPDVVFKQKITDDLPLRACELLGVSGAGEVQELCYLRIFRQNDTACGDGTGKRAGPHLIDAEHGPGELLIKCPTVHGGPFDGVA
jgi:hypothetical protein